MRVTYLDLVDYLAIAAEVTGLGVATLSRVTQLNLAEELYPDFVDKAAVLVVRLAKNHPLPDGNKRAAWVSLRAFIELNDWSWATYPSIDEAEQAMVAIASGEWDEARVASWLRGRIKGPARGEAPTERS